MKAKFSGLVFQYNFYSKLFLRKIPRNYICWDNGCFACCGTIPLQRTSVIIRIIMRTEFSSFSGNWKNRVKFKSLFPFSKSREKACFFSGVFNVVKSEPFLFCIQKMSYVVYNWIRCGTCNCNFSWSIIFGVLDCLDLLKLGVAGVCILCRWPLRGLPLYSRVRWDFSLQNFHSAGFSGVGGLTLTLVKMRLRPLSEAKQDGKALQSLGNKESRW